MDDPSEPIAAENQTIEVDGTLPITRDDNVTPDPPPSPPADDTAPAKKASGEEEGAGPVEMEIHDIDESHAEDDLDKSTAPSEKSMEVSQLNSSAIDPFDSLLKNTSSGGGESTNVTTNKTNNDTTDKDKNKTEGLDDSNLADEIDLPKLPDADDDSRPAELDRDAATPDIDDLDEPEAAPSNASSTRDNSPARDDDAPAEGKKFYGPLFFCFILIIDKVI